MISFKKINLNRPYYFFSDIKNVDPNLLSINKISLGSINNPNIDSENPLSFSDVDAYIIEERGSKSLIFALAKKSQKVLEIHKKLWNETKKQIKAVNGCESVIYKKDFMKFRFDSYNDDLPLGKEISSSGWNIAVKSVFKMKTNIIHKFIYMSVNMNVSMN